MALGRAALCLLTLLVVALTIRGSGLTLNIFQRQDAPVLAFTIVILFVLSASPAPLRLVPDLPVPKRAQFLLIGMIFIVAAGGTWLVFSNFDLSRDEFLANFDADVFSSGRLTWPVAPEWRSYSKAMMPVFMRDIPAEAGWISGYLPGNAALRALAERTIGKEFTSPLLSVIAAYALFRIARKLWPEQRNEALLALLLLAVSPQFLIMAMTPFAMTAHLTLNLLWLLCFLQDNRRGDAGAVACGFVATGLHQVIYHPLFAAPFIVDLLIRRRFRRAFVFVGGYAAICVFWILYSKLFGPSGGGEGTGSVTVGGGVTDFAAHAEVLLRSSTVVVNGLYMLLNIIRFAAWQHPFLLVLVLCCWPAISRAEGIARPLLGGIILMLLTTFLLIPWQGNGWGYRYLHGLLGNFCLLAVYGWVALRRFSRERRAALTLTTAATVAIILPFQMATTRAIVTPYREASSFIEKADAEVVLVDQTGMLLATDVIRNTADFGRRPKSMDIELLSETQLRELCKRYKVRLFDRRHGSRAGIPVEDTPDRSGARAILPAIGCNQPLPLSSG
jgi:hypothetical protein